MGTLALVLFGPGRLCVRYAKRRAFQEVRRVSAVVVGPRLICAENELSVPSSLSVRRCKTWWLGPGALPKKKVIGLGCPLPTSLDMGSRSERVGRSPLPAFTFPSLQPPTFCDLTVSFCIHPNCRRPMIANILHSIHTSTSYLHLL